MTPDDLQERIQQLRALPLLLICRTPKGKGSHRIKAAAPNIFKGLMDENSLTH